MRIAIYSRKSVYTGKGESIENQVEMCRQYISSRIEGGADAEIAVYEDEGFSGKNLDRPQFQRMLADTRARRTDYIVCYRLDRISRSVGDFAPLVEDLIARDIGFVCIKEQFDTSTPMGKAMMYIASVFAQLERETIAERVRDNMLLLARDGRWLGGTPPTGFRSERVEECVVDGKVKTSFRLRPDPAEMGTVRLLFQKYLELRSLSGVSKDLCRAGVRNRRGDPYSLPGLKDILRNPVYCTADEDARAYFLGCGSDVCFSGDQSPKGRGLLSYNKRGGGKTGHSRLDKSQWIVAAGRHRGIVSGADWVRVQRLLEERAAKAPRRTPQSNNGYSLLSGHVFCAKCGARMFAKRRSNSETLFDYICGSKLRGGGLCDCQNLSGREADGRVRAYLLERAREDGGILRLLEELRRRLQDRAPADIERQLGERIEKAQREMDGLVAALAAAGGSPPVIRHVSARMERLDQELERLRLARERAAEERAGERMTKARIAELAHTLAGSREGFSSMSIHEQRDFVRLLVERMEWDGRDLHIYLYGGREAP